jgi:hypothetical protein
MPNGFSALVGDDSLRGQVSVINGAGKNVRVFLVTFQKCPQDVGHVVGRGDALGDYSERF